MFFGRTLPDVDNLQFSDEDALMRGVPTVMECAKSFVKRTTASKKRPARSEPCLSPFQSSFASASRHV